MPVSTVAERHRAVRLLSHIEELLAIDDVWTWDARRTSAPRTATEVEESRSVGRDIGDRLTYVMGEVGWFTEVAQQNPAWWTETITNLVGQLPEDTREPVAAALLSPDGLLERLVDGVANTDTIVATEKTHIAEELDRIGAGLDSHGDLSEGTRCFLQGAVVGLTAAVAVGKSSAGEGVFAVYQAVELVNHCF